MERSDIRAGMLVPALNPPQPTEEIGPPPTRPTYLSFLAPKALDRDRSSRRSHVLLDIDIKHRYMYAPECTTAEMHSTTSDTCSTILERHSREQE